MAVSPGRAFAEALGRKDAPTITTLLTEDVDFRGLTPGRFWEAGSSGDVLEVLLGHWFPEQDRITEVLELAEGAPVEDTAHVSYRFALSTPDGPHTAEQHVYYRTDGERISYLRVMCSGFRPA